jgi:hypothetical protein
MPETTTKSMRRSGSTKAAHPQVLQARAIPKGTYMMMYGWVGACDASDFHTHFVPTQR